jgi:beta-galactosidase beta subunit
LETHNEFIDIQIPLSGIENNGVYSCNNCTPADAAYNAEKDITFFEG